MNEPAIPPAKRRRISTPAERLRRAELAVEKARAAAEREQVRLARAAERDRKAAERLAIRTRQVEKYETIGNKRKRELDTRRKIIVGALALKHMEFDGLYAASLRALIDEYVTRDQDRALFELPPLPDDDQRRVNPPVVY